ncbi:MAG: ATP-dependent DNA ligase [Cytophagales bacterium]
MKQFIELFEQLDQTQSTNKKLELLKQYFISENPKNLAFAVHLLMGKKRSQLVSSKSLKEWLLQKTGYDFWIFQECYDEVGDLAETIHLLLPSVSKKIVPNLVEDFKKLKSFDNESDKKIFILDCWEKYDSTNRFLFNKIISGSLRVGVSDGLVLKALSESFNLSVHHVTKSLMGNWDFLETDFLGLINGEGLDAEDISAPYPFCLAHSLEMPISNEQISNWLVEMKWDGIRCQIIKRSDEIFIWSRGEELVNNQFPDLVSQFSLLPNGTVLDGEILAFSEDFKIESFNQLQKRLNRKQPSKKLISEIPCFVMAYDLLEWEGVSLTNYPLVERRKTLESAIQSFDIERIRLSDGYIFDDWKNVEALRTNSSDVNSEGLMLKNLNSLYVSGRKTNVWLKWKSSPLTIDAVLLYAQKGHGVRSGLYTDFTFGLWKNGELVPFAKAYSGLDKQEIGALNQWISQNTIEKFGPVRTVKAEKVFEIAFEGVNESKRHKSGYAVRFPRILRWRKDKTIHEANDVEELKRLMSGNE